MDQPIRLFDCRLDASARQVVDGILASGALATGPFVSELESKLDDRFAGRASVVLSDMTQALAMALRLAGIGQDDEVLTLALNCMSSNSAISLVGARPVWVDIDPRTLTIDLADCALALTPRTKALIVYHVSGYPADIVELENFCRGHGLVLIEDANNAFGARSGDRPVGTAGQFSVFSFYANRQINAVEGAALLCADASSAERARRLRRFGVDTTRFRDAEGEIANEMNVAEIGVSASMANVNAGLACHQLDRFAAQSQRTIKNAAIVVDAISTTRLAPIQSDSADPAFWTFVVRCAGRDQLMRTLKSNGIQCSKLHQRNDRYSGFDARHRDLPGTTIFENEMLALPIGWWLEESELVRITAALRDWDARQ